MANITFPILLYIAITLPVPRAITKGGVGERREEGKEEEEEERKGREQNCIFLP